MRIIIDDLILRFRPVNFIDEVHRRWAYAACFVILTNDMLGHFVHQGYLNLLLTDDEKWMRKVVWIRGRTYIHDFMV